MKTKVEKTNAMRRLDALKIKYKEHTYTDTDAVSGVEVAEVLNQEPGRVFKTLVTQGKSRNYYVFMVPVAEELDLKKAAKAVGENEKAELIAKTYLNTVAGEFVKSGRLWEKYDGEKGGAATVNEYDVPEMLGWTAGMFEYFYKELGL